MTRPLREPTAAQLCQVQPTGEVTGYTATVKTTIRDVIITAAADDVVSISVVPSGGTAGAANRIVNALPIGPSALVGQVVRIPMEQVVEIGAFISVYGRGGATVTISGTKG